MAAPAFPIQAIPVGSRIVLRLGDELVFATVLQSGVFADSIESCIERLRAA